MDLVFADDKDHLTIRSPQCIRVALNQVEQFEKSSRNRSAAADVCENLLLTGLWLFGPNEEINRECALYLADLWQKLGKTSDALTLNYVTLMNSASLLDFKSLEIRLRMAELLWDLKAGKNSSLKNALHIILVEELLRDVLDQPDPDHQLTVRVQRQVIRAQSQHMDLKWTLNKYKEILELGRETLGIDSDFTKDTNCIMAHNLQEVLLQRGNELDEKTSSKVKHLNDEDSLDKESQKSLAIRSKSSDVQIVWDQNGNESTIDQSTTSNDKDLFLRKSLTAASLLAQGKHHLAVQLYQELLFYTSSTFGETDQTTLSTKQTLAAILDQQGRFDEALHKYKETLTTAHSALGHNHRVTKMARKQMGELTKKLERLNVICTYYTHERFKSDWFNRIFVMIMSGFLLWLLVELYVEHF